MQVVAEDAGGCSRFCVLERAWLWGQSTRSRVGQCVTQATGAWACPVLRVVDRSGPCRGARCPVVSCGGPGGTGSPWSSPRGMEAGSGPLGLPAGKGCLERPASGHIRSRLAPCSWAGRGGLWVPAGAHVFPEGSLGPFRKASLGLLIPQRLALPLSGTTLGSGPSALEGDQEPASSVFSGSSAPLEHPQRGTRRTGTGSAVTAAREAGTASAGAGAGTGATETSGAPRGTGGGEANL